MTDTKALRDKLDNPPLSWAPRGVRGDLDADRCITDKTVVGVVDSIEDRESSFGPFKMVTIAEDGGRRIQIAGLGTVLDKRFQTLAIGDGLAVRYLGKKPSSVGEGAEDYDDYAVEIEKAGA